MKNYKVWLVIVLALLAINSIALGVMWFQHNRPAITRDAGEPRQRTEPKDILISALNFTPRQAALFDTMRTKHQQAVKKLNNENHVLRDSLFANIKKTKADTQAINTIAKKISDNQAQIEKITLYHFRELRDILTPVQQTKFDGIIAQVLQMMGNAGPPPDGRPPMSDEQESSPQSPDKMRRHHHGLPQGNTPPGPDKNRQHFGPPPNGMPPPGQDGPPPYGPPRGGRPQ